MHSDFGQGAHP